MVFVALPALASLLVLVGSVVAHSAPSRFESRAAKAQIIQRCAKSGQWAITLDDGPGEYQNELLALAKKHKVPMTVFLNGNNWNCIYAKGVAEDLQKMYQNEHFTIGSHQWLHEDAALMTSSQFKSNVTKLDTALNKILGVKPAFFRFPYGSYNTQRLEDLAELGVKHVFDWSVDSHDGDEVSTVQQKKNLNVGLKQYPKPQISLEHEPYKSTIEVTLPYLIQHLKSYKYKAVSLAECMGGNVKPYRGTVGSIGKRDSSWHC